MTHTFELWTPPVLDLSLDSFSNDLIQEFDKTRKSMQSDQLIYQTANDKKQEEQDANVEDTTVVSPVSSFTTVPTTREHSQTEEEEEEEEQEEIVSTSTTSSHLFRKSSTFLKGRLNSTKRTSLVSSPEDISSIVSRQYPPKPLQYSPIVEPPSDTSVTSLEEAVAVTAVATSSNLSATTHHDKRETKPSQAHQNHESRAVVSTGSPMPSSTTKRRSFFSLRFC
ncbi:uncharacterized protein B0P05DRAFT_542420 [Gilbertella persicaria]|uniref:uncharacterized protein n=1 Tax=Gilbertella persicaria TaxID=101096 RepID=UPI002220A632|nr:uncharacterized protein B0P05DRAFT_542420 [Gilbertella persicaria]KAI8079113.1 hypothetical protein B0P05DRAFT_542420 [Gilbertella persicaria]